MSPATHRLNLPDAGLGRLRRRPRPASSTSTRARVAVTALFALNGFVFGSWAARVPDVSAAVEASASELGIALLCISLGALATMQLTGALCARVGSGLVSAMAAALTTLAVVLPGLATSVTGLAVALLAFGGVTGMGNVAANSLGVAVQSGRPRPLMPSLHAGFSFGGLAGALTGGLASAHGPVDLHLLGVAALGLLVLAVSAPTLVAADRRTRAQRADAGERRRALTGPRGVVVVLGVIAGSTAFGEGSITDWGALHLRESLHASPFVAAAGYAGFSLAMAVGRLGGGALLTRLGDTRLLVSGAALAAVGVLAAALSPLLGVALAGFVLVGLGLANIFPVAIARAGALGGPNGVALASTVGYSGLLGGPPVIGFAAEAAGIPLALTTISVLAVTAALLAAVVHGDRNPAVVLALATRMPGRVVALSRRQAARLLEGSRTAVHRHASDLSLLTEPAMSGSSRQDASLDPLAA